MVTRDKQKETPDDIKQIFRVFDKVIYWVASGANTKANPRKYETNQLFCLRDLSQIYIGGRSETTKLFVFNATNFI